MWLLTCNATVELPHNAPCIYNAPLREFADLIGTLLRITSCPPTRMHSHGSGSQREPEVGSGAAAAAAAEQVVLAATSTPPNVLLHLLNVLECLIFPRCKSCISRNNGSRRQREREGDKKKKKAAPCRLIGENLLQPRRQASEGKTHLFGSSARSGSL